MSLGDAIKVCTAVVASLGGGGAIVYGISNFLGKRWAERALEEDRHKFTTLTLQFQSQLEILGLVHKLRTQEEFNRLAGLWKRIGTLRGYMNALPHPGFTLTYADKVQEKQRQDEIRAKFVDAQNEAGKYLNEEVLFVPKPIADAAYAVLAVGQGEIYNIVGLHDLAQTSGEVYRQYMDTRSRSIKDFNDATEKLELLMRSHIEGRMS